MLPIGPGRGRDFDDPLDGAVIESRQDGGEILAYRDLQSAAALDYREYRGDLGPGLSAAQVDPVSSSNRDSPDILPMSIGN
jgi:hypothetical protein